MVTSSNVSGDSSMSTLQIRNLPEDVRCALELRARRSHRSLAQQALVELRRLPELAAAEGRKAVVAAIRASLQDRAVDEVLTAPERLIREDRDR